MRPITAGRKAQIEMHFNWIFVLIIGAVILGFFITVINNQQKRGAAEEATELVQTLDSVFATITTNSDTVQTFRIRQARLEITCEPGLSHYYIQGAGPQDTKNEALFSPRLLEGEEIISWTQTWSVPYDAGSLTMIGNDRTLFLFVIDEDDSVIAELYEEMPDEYRKVSLGTGQAGQYATKGYDRYVIISEEAIQPQPAIADKASQRIISQEADLDGHTTITDGEDEEFEALGRPLVWGAIFSEDEEHYECNLEKVRRRQRIIAGILEQRSLMIADELSETRCYDFFSEATTILSGMAGDEDLEGLSGSAEELYAINQLIRRGPACPLIY